MVILAVDYGDARTGLAICDKFEMLASPLCTVNQRDAEKLICEISTIVAEHKAEQIVVGLPKNMDSSEGERAQKCVDFARALSKQCGVDAVMYDERLTTVSAHNALNLTNTRGKKRKETVDMVAATMILQDYLDFRRLHK